ncbi:HlyD family secretion protein [Blastochloris viridis]|uniref:Probable Co/Zn/Cd efflux system membrane fusion protein n=1 Tax=Blastochloris viridis TaxID=1079 RepID=A0A0H5BPY7_BLAVI|nr:efflux RND transporter periplasmic adaptor subunit [Blastochloris viridis]ALK09998.1 Toluene efflux pump periplasmic linker protein TtgD precursor [Blastochloris viridis]BAS00084.1 probable Co/Zn/Cd efflux system membrane fusion protein [Blastochloris viridis]CUU42662.1 putative efflux pump periplasmic linker ttgA precursor [Blastochloris viridis]
MSRIAAVVVCALLAGCGNADVTYQGWVEADMIFVGPDESGRVETLAVEEGGIVSVGAELFGIDTDLQRSDLASAEAQQLNAKSAFARAEELLKTRTGTQRTFDEAQALMRDAAARVDAARTRLARRKVASPVGGTVQQVYFRPGEVVGAGRPVVALLPPANLKIRFFLPQGRLPLIALGDKVTVACDGCAPGLSAKVSFISRQAEFTPPVIYSLEERAKLVFMVEAKPDDPAAFRVGQPVQVRTPEPPAAAPSPARAR